MNKLILLVFLAILFSACERSGRGHITGVLDRPDAFYADPPGMVFIPMGSFVMGASDQDIAYSHAAVSRRISIPAFYMDETEITNNQYRQFVYWVRDSLARTLLATIDPEFLIEEDQDGNVIDPPVLNWRRAIRWDGLEERETLEELYLPENERFFRRREIDSRKLIYRYFLIDLTRAARRGERDTPRSEFVIERTTPVYPDTLAWIHDFTYAYNEPMTQYYFWHPTYDHYPVVGVNWLQARAFNVWRTHLLNSYRAAQGMPFALNFSLPSEAQWEYAARGGLELSPFPWGGPYIRNQNGCFLANFKPMRGDYVADGGYQTVIVGRFPPNDFGLYDMAGNVAEWTRNAFDESFYFFGSDMNPDFQREVQPGDPPSLRRKVVRGGSWKDIGFFLQVGTREFEYQDTAKSFIGFRSIQTFPGRDVMDRRRSGSHVYR
ncbi:MAG TPA: gliding motility-associated lipoprotein [Bacteroidales bacterium]|nr:gliding motility-associated lipoprotein [Bacteroidales bacterium]